MNTFQNTFIPYLPGSQVIIKALGSMGRIEQVLISEKCTTYELAYWFNGERKTAWMHEDELGK
jgi:hypothetical protein